MNHQGEDYEIIGCACGLHALVLDVSEWNCAFDDEVGRFLSITMWEQMKPRETGRSHFFYWPAWAWRFKEVWKAWKGERYAEWVMLSEEQAKRLSVMLQDKVTR